MSHLHRLLLVILLGAMQPSLAMQLGASKGSAVFGRPLDLTIPVRFDTPVEDPFNCFSAEVFQADAKFDAGRVRIDVTPASNGLDAMVRIRSNTAVVEPWAKVILRNNCGAKVTRQYDFLTDFVADLPAIASQTESIATNNLPTTTIVGDTSTKQNTQAATISNALPLLPSAPVSNWSVKRAQSSAQTNSQATNQASVPAPTKPRRTLKPNAVEPKPTAIAAAPDKALGKVAPMSQSRLKMETFELTDEHQVLLKLSTAMIAPSAMRTPEEIQALAQATAVWRAINGMPAVAAATVAQPAPPANTPAVAAVRTMPNAIVKDGKYEFSNPIVYGLMGLLALTLACIAWLWFQVRRRTQIGYSWLEETAVAEAPVQTEPPQVTQRWSTDTTFVPEDQIDEFVELTNTQTEEPRVQLTEAALDASPLEALKSIKDTLTLQKSKTSSKIKAKEKETKEFSAANPPEKSPEHFDDSRFDEQQLITKFNTSLVQEDVINALNESVDFVVPDATPKLRSVPSPVLPVETEMELENLLTKPQIVSAEPQQASTNLPKKELQKDLAKELPKEQAAAAASKGNLIDFDVFAEQAPLPKPSRFSR